jgi:hypothetical protein
VGDASAAVDALDHDERFRRYYDNARVFARFSAENEDWFERFVEEHGAE